MKKTTVQPTSECYSECPYCDYTKDYSDPPKENVQTCPSCGKKYKVEFEQL